MASSKATNNSETAKGKTTKSKKKGTKRKRANVAAPKMNNLFKPADMSLAEWQIALRKQQAEKETFAISLMDEKFAPDVYHVRNAVTRQEYKVVYRGKDSIWNFCSCFDYKTSQLGTCKHIEAVKKWTKQKRKKVYSDVPTYTSVYIDYNGPRRVRIRIGEDHQQELETLARDYFDDDFVIRKSAFADFDIFMQKAKAIDANFRCYNDALDYIIEEREKTTRETIMDTHYSDEQLDKLLTVNLYPYQKEGIRFAINKGKAIIADEMGLGKTVQAIASAEIYLREGFAESILIVCPTSLKYQWKKEIEKFTGSDQVECDDEYVENGRLRPKVVVVEGNPSKREALYKVRAPYKIVSYHAMANDIKMFKRLRTDVLIMDEIQRLKNWDTIISRAARKIDCRYAVLLSGTPLENKLEELYSTMELADQFCFGPYYKFRHDHILLDPDTGKIIGYKNLNSVGEQASKRLIRRTKKDVQLQLPKRSDQYILVPMTQEQTDYHSEFKWEVTKILSRYKKLHFMSEQDRRRLMLLLGEMRMVSDSTFILEQDLKKRHDIKIAEVINLLENVFANGDEKVVIFSEWERMTRLVAMELDKRNIRYEYLCGNVPSKQRGQLVENFTTLTESRVFISTDAGSTGLNLQVASILINLDLPWNPAILEQRIARIYRLGQERPVQILNLVSKNSFEEGMIEKLRFKTSMFEGVLDGGEDMVFLEKDKFKKFMEELDVVMKDTPEVPIVEYVDEEPEVEKISDELNNIATDTENTILQNEDSDILTNIEPCTTEQTSQISTPSTETSTSTETSSSHPQPHTPCKPKELVNQGISFLSGLSETLKSPEATQQLIDSIVDIDKETGQTNIKIPVANKETVSNVLQLLGKLFGG